ncbi:MAG: hypothetical protein ACMG6E_03830, partial [Candidatus Roizmanbacteria bacterium]
MDDTEQGSPDIEVQKDSGDAWAGYETSRNELRASEVGLAREIDRSLSGLSRWALSHQLPEGVPLDEGDLLDWQVTTKGDDGRDVKI